MNIWLAFSLVLVVVTVYMLAIEIFSVAFKLTGLVMSKVRLQVASLFTSSGYTTAESELIAKDERRRKIAIACMYTGHIFSVAFMGLIINVVISISLYEFKEPVRFDEWYAIVFYITFALFATMLVLKIPPVNRRFQTLLERIGSRKNKRGKKSNTIRVIDLHGKHATAEVTMNIVPDFCKDISLEKMGLGKKYSLNILSIRRDSRYVEVTKDTMFQEGDIVLIYGLINDIKEGFIYSVGKEKVSVDTDNSNEINLINNYGENALVEVCVVDVPKELENVKIANANLKEKYGITVGIINRQDRYITVNKDSIIQKGDTLTLFGPYLNIKLLFKKEDSNN